jgi:hypothetical protein
MVGLEGMAEWLLEEARECAGGVGGGSGPAPIRPRRCFNSLVGLGDAESGSLGIVAASRARASSDLGSGSSRLSWSYVLRWLRGRGRILCFLNWRRPGSSVTSGPKPCCSAAAISGGGAEDGASMLGKKVLAELVMDYTTWSCRRRGIRLIACWWFATWPLWLSGCANHRWLDVPVDDPVREEPMTREKR